MTKSLREIYNRPLFAGRWTLDVGSDGRLRLHVERWDIGRWTLVIADMSSVQHNLLYPCVDYHISLPRRILPRINLPQRIYTSGENRALRLKAANRDPCKTHVTLRLRLAQMIHQMEGQQHGEPAEN